MSEQQTAVTTKKPPTRPDIPASRWPKDPVQYLLQKGWTPIGDPNHPQTCWLDPRKPDRDIEERRKVCEKVLPNKKKEDVYQTFVTPRVFPIALADAVQEQILWEQSQGK
jgi:hypothetical protein